MRCRTLLLAAALAAGSGSALAQSQVDQAKTYFNAGAAAYEAGQYLAALQAFEEAYRLSPRPGILFSMAQAHKKQFHVDRNPEHLHTAVKQYREYLDKVTQGGRRADAVQGLGELEPLVARMGAPDPGAAAPAARPVQTRIMVSSQTPNAEVSLDGAAAQPLPLIAEVKPGKHTIKVTAKGYHDEQQDLTAVEGGLVPRDVALREKPVRISVAAPNGSDVTVDGRPMGVTPLPQPIEVAAGRHFVAVTKPGNYAFSQEVDLERGESKAITAQLQTTNQRIASFIFLGAGATAGAIGTILLVQAFQQQTAAEVILAAKEKGNISEKQRREYEDSISARDANKALAVSVYGGAIALGAVGLMLYVFDQPTVNVPALAPKSDDKPKPTSPTSPGTMEVSASPVWSPQFTGGALNARF